MLQLIEAKGRGAQRTHQFVTVDGDTTLQELFRENRYQQILSFLRHGRYQGHKLIVPRVLEESYFYDLIHEGGLMAGLFSASERQVVEDWIMSLR